MPFDVSDHLRVSASCDDEFCDVFGWTGSEVLADGRIAIPTDPGPLGFRRVVVLDWRRDLRKDATRELEFCLCSKHAGALERDLACRGYSYEDGVPWVIQKAFIVDSRLVRTDGFDWADQRIQFDAPYSDDRQKWRGEPVRFERALTLIERLTKRSELLHRKFRDERDFFA